MLALLFRLPLQETMEDKDKIAGAPDWAHEFLDRVGIMNEVTKDKVLAALGDVSETMGGIAATVSRLDGNVSWMRRAMHNISNKITTMEVELQELRDRILHLEEGTEKVPELLARMNQLEADLRRLHGDLESLRGTSDQTPAG